MIMDDLLRGREAIAAAIGVSPASVSRLGRDGCIPIFYLGGTMCARESHLRLVLEADAERALERCDRGPGRLRRDDPRRRISRPTDPRPRAISA